MSTWRSVNSLPSWTHLRCCDCSRSTPQWQQDLIARLQAHDFDKVVLHNALRDTGWWEHIDFGVPVIDVIEVNYRLKERLRWRDLSVYVPNTNSSVAARVYRVVSPVRTERELEPARNHPVAVLKLSPDPEAAG